MKKDWKNEKLMSKKEFNRDYMVRFRTKDDLNLLVGYDHLRLLLGFEKFVEVLKRVSAARSCKVVIHPYHFCEVTFYAH